MPTAWSQLLELSLANRLLLAVAGAVSVVWIWTTFAARRRNRGRTVYIVRNDSRFTDGPVSAPDASPPVDAEPDTERPSDAELAPAWSEDWAGGRRLCPCCDYPTDYTVAHACSFCDWQDPPAPEVALPFPVPGRDSLTVEVDPDDALQDARACYRATGSAFRPEDRPDFNGVLTPRALDLRKQIHERLDYLRTADRPDTSETWELIDHLFNELRDEMC